MADTPQKKVSSPDGNFQKFLETMQDQCHNDYQNRSHQNQPFWTLPVMDNWDGDLFKISAIKNAFTRREANEKYIEAVTDPESSGTTGDLAITTMQIDYMATAERAFRARHTYRWPRAYAQELGRVKGRGGSRRGMYAGILDSVTSIIQETG